jgi:hypothetical protein
MARPTAAASESPVHAGPVGGGGTVAKRGCAAAPGGLIVASDGPPCLPGRTNRGGGRVRDVVEVRCYAGGRARRLRGRCCSAGARSRSGWSGAGSRSRSDRAAPRAAGCSGSAWRMAAAATWRRSRTARGRSLTGVRSLASGASSAARGGQADGRAGDQRQPVRIGVSWD